MSTIETHAPLAPPDPGAEPQKSNVFVQARTNTTELAPMFPDHLGPSDIVTGVSLVRGDDGPGYGRFFHRNSEEEVVVVWSTNDAFRFPGVLIIVGKMHEVTSNLSEPDNPDAYLIATITQRQAPAGQPQKESVIFRCEECNGKIFQHDYDATPEPVTAVGDGLRYAGFTTIDGSADAADRYNAEMAGRPCPSCGHEAPAFPLELWGWTRWRARHAIVNRAKVRLDEVVAELEQGVG